MLSEEGIGPTVMIARCPTKDRTLFPLTHDRSCHFPPRTPLPRAANIRSVHTDAATHDHVRGSSGADAGLAVARTRASAISVLCIILNLSYPPSCPPFLGAGLLTALSRHFLFRTLGACLCSLFAA
jgi:hypothetical protein